MPGRASISESATQNAATMISTPGAKRPVQSVDESRPSSMTYSVAATQPVEPEDAYLTGVSRSLQRRLLGLNVNTARRSNPVFETAGRSSSASLHEIGSGAVSGPAKNEKDFKIA